MQISTNTLKFPAVLFLATVCLFNFCIIYLVSSSSVFASSLTVSIASNISLDLAPSGSSTFASSDTTSPTVSVTTDNYTGYTLSIAAKTNSSTALTYTNNGNVVDTIPSITSAVSASNYANDSYATSNGLNNTWGFRPSKYNSNDNTDYLPIPSSTTATTLDATSTPNTTANTYNIAIGARVGMDKTPGDYTNTFVIAVLANATPYSITYNANTTSSVSNMPSNESSTTFDNIITLSSNIPTRIGYNFTGWCTAQMADDVPCTGTTYATGSTWTLDKTASSNSLTLYATWLDPCAGKTALYELVECRSKGTQTAADLQQTITTDNSGVYEYDSTVFGAANDAASTHKIYYYRGILDSSFAGTDSYGETGSSGDGVLHPNYVILDANGTKDTSDTCWRIVRTTGSGGVKMIYNGKWTGSTCANTTTAAQVADSPFSGTASSDQQIVRVGYTYNSAYATNTASTASIGAVLGTNNIVSVNDTDSTIKDFIENTFFPTIISYESILEPSAGYCNDRSIYNDTAPYTLQPESTNIVTYGTSNMAYYRFGPYIRNGVSLNNNNNRTPTLGCTRYIVDLYTVAGSTPGNEQMNRPAALLTADEASFAGSGIGTTDSTSPQGSEYDIKSYLRSGSTFWLLSPYHRTTTGYARGSVMHPGGYARYGVIYNYYGVRPVISLVSGTLAASGSGTAADPWVIVSPPVMQDFTASMCQEQASDGNVTVYDRRDGSDYTVRYINGACWMTQNLRITHSAGQADWTISSVDSNFDNVPTWNIHTADLKGSSGSYTQAQSHVADIADSSHYSITQLGAWYNFCAVSANNSNGCNNSGSYIPASGPTTGDICPAGWHLPTSGNSAGQFGSIIPYESAFQIIVKNGYYENGSNHDFLTTGYWWSATALYGKHQYMLYHDGNRLYNDSVMYKYFGIPVRCVRTS